MSASRLLLVPSFTELEWGIRPELEEWAEVASFDMPGIGLEPLPAGVQLDPDIPAEHYAEMLAVWRKAGAEIAEREVDRRGWDEFLVVTDSRGISTAIGVAERRTQQVQGLAFGHAALSHSGEGPRAPERAEIWNAVAQLADQGSDAFVRHGIAQATRGGVDEETAQQMIQRFPDMRMVKTMIEALGANPEPIGERLAGLGLPLLLAKHEGCLGSTDEGFEDIVAALSDAQTVICPEACPSSPAFAAAIRELSESVN